MGRLPPPPMTAALYLGSQNRHTGAEDSKAELPSWVLCIGVPSMLSLGIWRVISSPWDISSGKAISILEGACFRYYEASMIPPFLLLRDRGLAVSWPSISIEFWDLQSGQCVNNSGNIATGLQVHICFRWPNS
jgi:hypothetical protein